MTRKIVCSAALLTSLCFVAGDARPAQAAHGHRGFGIHIGGRNVHLDIGNPHGYRHSAYRSSRYQAGCRSRYYAARPRYDWHDTSHYDYYPDRFVPHGNHYDYVPGHYRFHRTGHWDRHHGPHH